MMDPMKLGNVSILAKFGSTLTPLAILRRESITIVIIAIHRRNIVHNLNALEPLKVRNMCVCPLYENNIHSLP